ncbi:MAG TPA: T9SS type A sorting domain-containing protein [Bacteroidia bacterium]|nr:T9SS type A sorting domain-containing protein [Bacteroidia bacterium]
MKTKLTRFLFILLATATLQTKAQSKLIHFWDFNETPQLGGVGDKGLNGDSLGNAVHPLTPSYTTLAIHSPKIVYSRPYSANMALDSIVDNGAPGSYYYDFSSTHYHYFSSSDSIGGDTNQFIRVRNPSNNAQLLFTLPTNGYKNLRLFYSISCSSTKAPQYTVFSYSTNGGTSWNPLIAGMDTFNTGGHPHPDTLQNVNDSTAVSKWYPVQISFANVLTANNNSKFMVRMTTAGSNNITTSGNLRMDNIALMGDTDITSSIYEAAINSAGYNVYPNPVQNVVNIISDTYNGNKIITLYNIVGETLSVTENDSKQTAVNISSLIPGIYFVEIKETVTGNRYSVKIVKE